LTMTEPDELYTLRAQYWMGHYSLCLEEAKTIARRPMSPALKEEREEFIQRAQLGLGQQIAGGDTPALQALALKSKYEEAVDEETKNSIIDEMKTLAAGDTSPSVQLYASQLYLSHGSTKDALSCVHLSTTMEHSTMALQIYLKLDRLDLASKQLDSLRNVDEDSVLTSLAAVRIALAGGSSTAPDAAHHLNSLSEQYGPSPMLLNLSACANCMTGDYVEAEAKLLECKKEFSAFPNPDTLVNLIVCSQYLNKPSDEYIAELKEAVPNHPFLEGLKRVEGAFLREAMKYKVAA